LGVFTQYPSVLQSPWYVILIVGVFTIRAIWMWLIGIEFATLYLIQSSNA